jgi:hypothetical protein
VLAATLLLCHGIYGYEHQFVGGSEPGSGRTIHAVTMGTHHTSSDHGGGGTGLHTTVSGVYFAVLISLLLSTFLWSWRQSFRMPAIRTTRRIAKRLIAPLVPHPPRAPTLYLFQVIRR